MNKIKFRLLILLLISVGFIHIYPDLRFIHELGDGFNGISLIGTADENVYLSRIAGVVYRKDLRLANAGVYGHQNDPVFQPSLAEVTEGLIGRGMGLEVWQIDILATFFLPALLCFLIYLLTNSLSGSPKTAALASLAVTLGYYWITPNLRAVFGLVSGYFNQSLFFTRPISPQFHFIPFIFALYLIHKVSSKKSNILILTTGIITGLLFYTSVYYWTFIYAGLFILTIISIIKKNTDSVGKYLLIYLISFTIAIPYLLSAVALNKLPYFPEIFRRGGGIYTHQPMFPVLEAAFLLFLIIMRYLFRDKKEDFYFMISFVAGGLVCLNQQIITGKTVEPMHWQSYTDKVFIIICFFICGSFILKRLKLSWINRFFYPACVLFLVLGITQQNIYFSARSGIFRGLQGLGLILRYIHKEIPADAVILTDPLNLQEERMLSVFTKNYPYISDSFFITSAIKKEEIEERYFFALNFFGYNHLEAEKTFKYMNGGLFRGMQVHPRYGGSAEKNNAYIESLKQAYLGLAGQDPVLLLRKYKVDYLLLDRSGRERILGNDKIANMLKLKYNIGLYSLYKLE